MARARNIANPNVKIPDNPIWIDFPRSDGEQRTWPSNTTRIEDANGEINWMKHVPIDDPVAIRWRLGVGYAIALDLDLQPAQDVILREWPANYRMYDHHKGKAGNPRHDIYLYGPQFKRFRSINEFIPHAIWVYRDETANTANCFCKYCRGIPQKVISSALGSIMQTPSQTSISAPPRAQAGATDNTAGPSSSAQSATGERGIYSALQKHALARRDKDRDSTTLAQRRAHRERKVKQLKGKGKQEPAPKVFASVQKQLKPMSELKPSENVVDMPMLADRNRDLRAVYSRSANDRMGVMGWDDEDSEALASLAVQSGLAPPPAQPNKGTPSLRRYFRENEIVWVHLPGDGIPMASLGASQNMNISVWPGMVKGSKIKNVPVPVSQSNPAASTSNSSGRTHPPPPQGLSGNSDQSASRLFPSTTSPLHAQSSSATTTTAIPVASGLVTPNESLPSSTPYASSGVHAPSVPLPNATSPAPLPNASATSTPSLPSRAFNPAATAPSSSSGSQPANSGNWTVTESIIYMVQLMAVDARVDLPATAVLPYLASAPADDFVEWLKAVPQYLNFERDSTRKFDPIDASRGAGMDGEDAMQLASKAISAYALALQTASHVCNDWSLTDKWDYQYVPPGHEAGAVRVNVVSKDATDTRTSIASPQPTAPESISAPMRTHTHTLTGGLSLASAIQDAGRANAGGPTSFSSKKMNLNVVAGTGPIYKEISGTSNSMTEQEVRQTAAGVLGVGPGDAAGSPPAPGALIQVRFQGMWWGSERIWVDDFVRVKVPRGALAPDGAPNVYKPSGWGKGNKEVVAKLRLLQKASNGGSPEKEESLESSDFCEFQSVLARGVFMKIGGIFVVDVPKPDGSKKKEGRVCGMLYELAELDWEETEPDLKEQYELEKQQRLAFLQRHLEVQNAVSTFQASVNESLLPSTSNKPSSLPAPPLQPSPPCHYLMPQAPKGYRFRPMLKTGYEAVLNLSLIAGRYYPRLLAHPWLAPKLVQEVSAPRWDLTEKRRLDLMSLVSLEGLSAGHYNAVDPQFHKKSRVQMLDEAEQAAFRDMDNFLAETQDPTQGEVEEHYAMEQDGDMEEDELAMNVD